MYLTIELLSLIMNHFSCLFKFSSSLLKHQFMPTGKMFINDTQKKRKVIKSLILLFLSTNKNCLP